MAVEIKKAAVEALTKLKLPNPIEVINGQPFSTLASGIVKLICTLKPLKKLVNILITINAIVAGQI